MKNTDKKLRLWILGAGSYVQDLKRIAEEEGVSDTVHFEGWKKYDEMQTYFGKSNVCLIPHIKSDHTDSTIPHKIFQYMYAGKPMLVSNCDPLKRIVEETNSGEVFEFDSPENFASNLEKLIQNTEYFSQEFVAKSQDLVLNNYNWELDSKVLKSLYK